MVRGVRTRTEAFGVESQQVVIDGCRFAVTLPVHRPGFADQGSVRRGVLELEKLGDDRLP